MSVNSPNIIMQFTLMSVRMLGEHSGPGCPLVVRFTYCSLLTKTLNLNK